MILLEELEIILLNMRDTSIALQTKIIKGSILGTDKLVLLINKDDFARKSSNIQ